MHLHQDASTSRHSLGKLPLSEGTFALHAVNAQAVAVAPGVPPPFPPMFLAPAILCFGFLPVLPAAVPVARSGDPLFPMNFRTACAAAWQSAVSDVRFRRRVKVVARLWPAAVRDAQEFAGAARRSVLLMREHRGCPDQEAWREKQPCAEYASNKFQSKSILNKFFYTAICGS